jgi:segregation and condensation protein A
VIAPAFRIAPPEAAAFVVEVGPYTGPLDLLLSLIRDEQVDIYDIPIARIAEQFLARIGSLGLDEAADYLEMAARLLRIKAQMLLPRGEGEEAWEDPRAELVRRLLEYQQMREVVDLLEHRGEARRHQFPRRWFPQPVDVAPVHAPLGLALPDLLAAVDRVRRSDADTDVDRDDIGDRDGRADPRASLSLGDGVGAQRAGDGKPELRDEKLVLGPSEERGSGRPFLREGVHHNGH